MNKTSQQLRKMAAKKKHRKDMLHQRKLETLPVPTPAEIAAEQERVSLTVYVREQNR